MGKLYLVPTPIGNLKDITLRAIEILSQVDLILAEDTRITKKLLDHYEINTKTKSYHIHNEHKELNQIISLLISDKKIALVSEETRTVVLFESPYRIIKLLNEIKDICGIEKNISISREISKIFEETIRGTVSECLSHFENNEPKGEFVICIEGLKS